MEGIGIGEQLTIADAYGGRYDGVLVGQYFDAGSRFVIIKMNDGDIDGDADELDERINASASKKRRKGRGLTKRDLGKNKSGKVVSKKKSAKEEKSPWIAACSAAEKALNIKDFAAIVSKKKSAKVAKSPMDSSMQRSREGIAHQEHRRSCIQEEIRQRERKSHGSQHAAQPEEYEE